MALGKKFRLVSKSVKIISRTKLFDESHYRNKYNITRYVNARRHYITKGWLMGFNPSPFFDTSYYLALYEDVRVKKINPLVHYLTNGGAELRRPSEAFDVNLFCENHPDFFTSSKTPAEYCIDLYGGYLWHKTKVTSQVSKEASDKFINDVFDEDFYISHNADVERSAMNPAEHFVNFGQFECRDPSPEFSTFYYRNKNKSKILSGKNIIELYFEHDSNTGASTKSEDSICINPNTKRSELSKQTQETRLCVHFHCFYPELIRELIPGLSNLPASSGIIITVTSNADAFFIKRCFARFKVQHDFDVRVVPNRGRDLAPFLVECRDFWKNFDVVLHLHTKRSLHVSWGDKWRQYLLDQTLGSADLVESIINTFSENCDVGCLYPRNYYEITNFMDYEQNTETIHSFMESLGFDSRTMSQSDYPAGSMAWYRSSVLNKLADTITSLDYFEEEKDQVDLTFAHALERIIPMFVRASGYKVQNYITPRRARLVPIKGIPERESSKADLARIWPRDTPKIAQKPPSPLSPISGVYNPEILDIHWIIPSFAQGGAGGHMTIFRMVEFLERFGHHQTLWFQNAVHFADQSQLKLRIQQWYRPIGSRVHVRFLPDDIRQICGDVLIATDCWTAYPAAQVQNVKERFYLVQDYEPSFHAVGDLQLTANATYEFGFANLCAGNWLLRMMEARGRWARAWELCADHQVYYPGASLPVVGRPVRIAFYARQYTPRRAVALGFSAFELLSKRGIRFEVDLFGEADLNFDYDFPFTQHGILTPAELGELYRSCDIGVVFSATNYSLIPLEMMACGLPVVELDTESTRAIFKNEEVCFAVPTPYGIADAIETLISDPKRQTLQREHGFAFTGATSWERSARMLEAALLERLVERGYTAITTDELKTPAIVKGTKATVFIPTYNAGPEFSRILDSIAQQVCDFTYDVLVIDSGSSDGTADCVRERREGIFRIEQIKNSDFQHGRTRNLGISRSEGDYVAVITQDACPRDRHWLSSLIGGFKCGPRIAGVIGRHEAYPEHDPFTRRDIEEMFDGLSLLPSVLDRSLGLPSYIYPGGQSWGMNLRFYSDNNSAMSRAAWKILPYPEISWGEDQVWAEEAMRLGFQKAYVDEAVVYHSHAFDLKQQYAVAVTEGRFWAQHFGIKLHPDPDMALQLMNERDKIFALQRGINHRILQNRQLLNRATVQGRSAGYHLTSECD